MIYEKEAGIDAPVEMSLDPTCVRSGMEKWVQMHGESKIQEIKDRVPDILKWMYAVWGYQVLDRTRTCKFIHEFMQIYAKEDNWAGKFESNNMLREKHFVLQQTSAVDAGYGYGYGYSDDTGGYRDSHKRSYDGSYRDQGGGKGQGKGKGQGQGKGKGKGSGKGKGKGKGAARPDSRDGGGRYGFRGNMNALPKFCISRLDKMATCHMDPYCQFDHHYPCCSSKHAASRCSKFDPAVAAAAQATR